MNAPSPSIHRPANPSYKIWSKIPIACLIQLLSLAPPPLPTLPPPPPCLPHPHYLTEIYTKPRLLPFTSDLLPHTAISLSFNTPCQATPTVPNRTPHMPYHIQIYLFSISGSLVQSAFPIRLFFVIVYLIYSPYLFCLLSLHKIFLCYVHPSSSSYPYTQPFPLFQTFSCLILFLLPFPFHSIYPTLLWSQWFQPTSSTSGQTIHSLAKPNPTHHQLLLPHSGPLPAPSDRPLPHYYPPYHPSTPSDTALSPTLPRPAWLVSPHLGDLDTHQQCPPTTAMAWLTQQLERG